MANGIEGRPIPPEDYVTPRIEFLKDRVYPRASQLWRETGTGYVFVEAVLHVPEAQATRAALALYDIDREARRAVRIITGRGVFEPRDDEFDVIRRHVESARGATPRRLLRPSSIAYGGFRLLRSEEGSADFFLDAYGLLQQILLNDPIQLTLTLTSIFGWPTRVVIRHFSRDHTPEPVRDVSSEFSLEDNGLRLASQLAPGTTLTLRYRGADGSEIEAILESPNAT